MDLQTILKDDFTLLKGEIMDTSGNENEKS
jgi:hypothetical protein